MSFQIRFPSPWIYIESLTSAILSWTLISSRSVFDALYKNDRRHWSSPVNERQLRSSLINLECVFLLQMMLQFLGIADH